MPTPRVLDKAKQVHAELEQHPGTEQLRAEIKTVLLRPEHAPVLRTKLQEFVAEHPKLAGLLQGLIDELNAAGI
jgi:hypothetical protein